MVSRELLDVLTRHLAVRGWTAGRCVECGARSLAPVPRDDCGGESCAPPRPALDHRLVFWDHVWPVVTRAFEEYTTTTRRDLVNHVGGTRFVGAGLQIFESAAFGGATAPTGPLFVPQPAIRLNYLDIVGEADGFSTAFVNLCSEQACGDLHVFLLHLDRWLACLHELGVDDSQLTLLLPSEAWIGGPFRGTSVVASVSGLEIGDLVWIDDGDAVVRRLLPIVDTSFGLERITAALNTDLGYSTLLGPMPTSMNPPLRTILDRLRTAMLMLMSGLEPSGRGRGKILRRLATMPAPQDARLDVDAVIRHAYNYWSTFHEPATSLDECAAIVRAERAQQLNRTLLESAGWTSNATTVSKMPTDEVCRQLLWSGVDSQRLSALSATLAVSPPPAVDPRSSLTVVVPTSPIPSHPSTGMLRRALRSLVKHAGLDGSQLLLVCDGVPAGAADLAPAYDDYKRRLRALAAGDQLDVKAEIVELDSCAGLGGAVRTALDHIRTPYLLMYEHDWRLTRAVDVPAILGLFAADREVHYVRLNKRRTHETGWDSVLKPDDGQRHLPLTRTGCWSANPHIARTSHYRRHVLPHLRTQPGGGSEGFEHPVFHAYQADIHRLGFDRAQRRWGVFILGPLGERPYVTHMDGRGSAGIHTRRSTQEGT